MTKSFLLFFSALLILILIVGAGFFLWQRKQPVSQAHMPPSTPPDNHLQVIPRPLTPTSTVGTSTSPESSVAWKLCKPETERQGFTVILPSSWSIGCLQRSSHKRVYMLAPTTQSELGNIALKAKETEDGWCKNCLYISVTSFDPGEDWLDSIARDNIPGDNLSPPFYSTTTFKGRPAFKTAATLKCPIRGGFCDDIRFYHDESIIFPAENGSWYYEVGMYLFHNNQIEYNNNLTRFQKVYRDLLDSFQFIGTP